MSTQTSTVQAFKPLPTYPLGQVHQYAEHQDKTHSIKDNANHVYHNRNAIMEIRERILNSEQGVNRAIAQVAEDLKQELLPTATKEAKKLLENDDAFRGLIIQALANHFKRLDDDYKNQLEALKKKVAAVEQKTANL